MQKKTSLSPILTTLTTVILSLISVTSCNEKKTYTNDIFHKSKDLMSAVNDMSTNKQAKPDQDFKCEEGNKPSDQNNKNQGPCATITNTSIDYDRTQSLVYHFNIKATGVNGHIIQPYLFILTDNREYLTDNGKKVCYEGQKLSADNDICTWTSQQTISVDIDNLHSLNGNHIYKARIFVWDHTANDWLSTTCDYKRYSFSIRNIKGANGEITGRIISPIKNPDAKPGKVHNSQHGDHGTIICANCAGTGREPCINCSGTGHVWDYYLNINKECSMCHGSGHSSSCPVCHGTGQRYY